jgi:hypothetical protein
MEKEQEQKIDDNIENISPDDIIVEKSLKPVEIDKNIDYSKEQQIYDELLSKYQGDHEKAIFEFCYKTDIPYSENIVKLLFKGKQDSVLNQMPAIYISTIKADIDYKDVTFFAQLKQENFEEIYKQISTDRVLTEEDKKNRMSVIDILAYDPFKDEDPADKPNLYRSMASMLTESMRKDVPKANAAITIIRNYNIIAKYDKKIAEITKNADINEETQKILENCMKIKKTLQDTINTTAEKNAFTVKGIGNAGKGMLSDVMNQISEKGIDEGVTNFYDIATSKSIKEIASMSFQAQLEQAKCSNSDFLDIINNQRELVVKAQEKARDAEEALRLAKEKITKQELLQELESEYKKKGISEEEIRDFISREYDLYDSEKK